MLKEETFFSNNSVEVLKNAEIYAKFKSVEKSLSKSLSRKVISQRF
jgi:hypothetical protein